MILLNSLRAGGREGEVGDNNYGDCHRRWGYRAARTGKGESEGECWAGRLGDNTRHRKWKLSVGRAKHSFDDVISRRQGGEPTCALDSGVVQRWGQRRLFLSCWGFVATLLSFFLLYKLFPVLLAFFSSLFIFFGIFKLERVILKQVHAIGN